MTVLPVPADRPGARPDTIVSPAADLVVSFHPVIEGDLFLWDRATWNQKLLRTLKTASAVILPQTVGPEFYHLCKTCCPKVFPNYDLRFRWPGKVGDSLLFWAYQFPHPVTEIYPRVETLKGSHPAMGHLPSLPAFPFVVKANHGGEGRQTWLVRDETELGEVLCILERLEWQGQAGFVIQEYLDGLERDLRVVVIGDQLFSYWRVNPNGFHHNLAQEGAVDHDADPGLQEAGRQRVRELCRRTGINLAGFDLVFPQGESEPLFLEINYTFGRTGLGGGEAYYQLLREAVAAWLDQGS